MRVEFAAQPPVFEIAPTINGLAIVRFYEDVQTVESEEGTQFSALCYETVVQNTINLYARIDRNLVAWIAKAKADTEKRAEEVLRAQRVNAVPERVTELEMTQDEMILLMADMIGGAI